jgi:succinate dehydrogenase / fumarate reductase, cytochrome b subunit
MGGQASDAKPSPGSPRQTSGNKGSQCTSACCQLHHGNMPAIAGFILPVCLWKKRYDPNYNANLGPGCKWHAQPSPHAIGFSGRPAMPLRTPVGSSRRAAAKWTQPNEQFNNLAALFPRCFSFGLGRVRYFKLPALPKRNNCITGGAANWRGEKDVMARVETDVSGVEKRRPLSPHLQIYRPMLTMVMSIAHRITGAVLYFGTLLLAWFLIAAAIGGGTFELAAYCFNSIPGRVILFGFTWALIHHFLGGIRHIIWDTGHGFEPKEREWLAQTTLYGGIALTAAVWVIAYLIQ